MLRAFPRLAGVLKRSVATDIPASRLPGLLEAAGGHQARVTTVGFAPPTYTAGWSAGYPIPDVPRIQRTVRTLLHLPGATAGKQGGGATTGAATTGGVAAGQPTTTRDRAAERESCSATG